MNLPWYKRDPEAFVTGVAGMSAEEVGVYQLLLDYQWIRGGRLPTDEDELLELLPRSVTSEQLSEMLAGKLGRKFDRDADGMFNRRLDREMEAAQESADKRRKAATKAARARWDDDAERMPDASDSHAEGIHTRARARRASSLSTSESSSVSEQEKQRPSLSHDYLSDFNRVAEERGWPQIRALTRKRRDKLRVRESEDAWDWPAIVAELERVAESWVEGFMGFGFDWLIENDTNHVKVAEGKYREKVRRRTDPDGIEMHDGDEAIEGAGWCYDCERLVVFEREGVASVEAHQEAGCPAREAKAS